MKRILFSLLFFCNECFAINTSSYQKISELKSWDKHIDIYFENRELHQCEGTHKTRFLSNPSKSNHLTLLLSAFMSGKTVMLAYNCSSDGFPWVTGVRVK